MSFTDLGASSAIAVLVVLFAMCASTRLFFMCMVQSSHFCLLRQEALSRYLPLAGITYTKCALSVCFNIQQEPPQVNRQHVCMQALSQALPGDAGVYLLLGMLRNAKGNREAAANAYAAAVRISLVSDPSTCSLPLKPAYHSNPVEVDTKTQTCLPL